MIFKKKDRTLKRFGFIPGIKVCAAKFNVKKNQDEAKVGYIIARKQCYRLYSNPYEEGGMYWKYLVKFDDGSTEEYKEEEIYIDYDRRLEDE